MSNKPKKSKKGSLAGATPFVLVRSATGRPFQRAGIRFPHDRDEPVNLDKLQPEQREALLATKQLSITYVTAEEYELALSESAAVAPENAEGAPTYEQLAAENAQLKADCEALRSEVALLTGRRKTEGGPRENEPKKPAALMG